LLLVPRTPIKRSAAGRCAAQGVMRKLKSIKNIKISLLLLLVFLAAIISEVRHEFSYNSDLVSFMENCVSSVGTFTADGLRIKGKFVEITVKSKWCDDCLPIANYLSLVREFLHPGDIHLPTKSDRAPPQTILS